MLISTRRIRERLEEDFPSIQWTVNKVRKRNQWRIHAWIMVNKKEYASVQIIEGVDSLRTFVDIITIIGNKFYYELEKIHAKNTTR